MAVVESVLRFGCLAVVLRRAASPPTPALYRRYVICGYDMWRWSSTAKVGVATSMFWSSPYKMARGVLNAIVVSTEDEVCGYRPSTFLRLFYFSTVLFRAASAFQVDGTQHQPYY